MAISKTKIHPEYQMKHRITGAMIMFVIAIVVIPILLKEPGIEASVGSNKNITGLQQTFKSKIEPLNLDNVNTLVTKADSPGEYDDIKPALLEVKKDFPSNESNDTDLIDGKQNKSEQSTQTASISNEPVILTPDKITNSKESAPVSSSEQSETSKANTSEGDVGWTVRVGTFTKIENVESVSSLLNNSGFKTRHTTVQTTLGEATRVWLGPYSEKETAVKVSARLKTLTGEKGYVTKQSS